MSIEGTELIAEHYIDALIARIHAALNLSDLQYAIEDGVQPITSQLDAIALEIQMLAPLLALLNPPTVDPTKIVTWITDFITAQIAPQVATYHKHVAQLAALTAKVAQIESALDRARERINDAAAQIPPI